MIRSLKQRLEKRELLGNLRELAFPKLASSNLIDFSSNDSLGLARSIFLAKAVFHEWEKHAGIFNGLSSTGSRLLTGNSPYAEQLEEAIAQFHGYEAGVLFSCGYMANTGLLSAVASKESTIFFDSNVHASIRDGIRLSRSLAYAFRHNDLEHLKSRLQKHTTNHTRLICIESTYSTDGSCAPLEEICQLAETYDAYLIIDEAHATGILGPQGRGLIAKYSLMDRVFAHVITFGKALGAHGAIVLGSRILKQALINFATPYIYTTALPFHCLAAIKCSYDLFPKMDKERKHVEHLISTFTNAFASTSKTHIQPVPIQGNLAVKHAAHTLARHGIDIKPLTSPTVQRNQEALRVCLHAFNTQEEVALLLKHLPKGLIDA